MHTTTTTTSTILFTTTSLLAALASSQSTVVYTGEPEQFAPSISLNPTQSAIVAKYTSDIFPVLASLATGTLVAPLDSYEATATALPTGAASAYLDAAKGIPIPSDGGALSVLPTQLRGGVVSAYDNIASLASEDLKGDAALQTLAPELLVPQEGQAPKETVVYSGSRSASARGSARRTGAAASGVAAPSGVAASSAGRSGVASASGTGSGSSSASATTSSAPIASVKAPGSGASRVSAGVGGLVVVGLGFVVML